MNELINYKKYRWFFTSTEKLVVGGKSATQNEVLLNELKKMKKDFFVMHTSTPGSPFAVILADKENVKKEDIYETAVFTGCFSREWRTGKKSANVDIFYLSQLHKDAKMKTGTWGIRGKIKRKKVELKLALVFQEGKLRAVPDPSAEKIIVKIVPGKIDKNRLHEKLKMLTDVKISNEDVLSALPSGGVKIIR